MDYNGTLAVDGEPVEGVLEALTALAETLQVHVITADTFGKVHTRLKGTPCRISILALDKQDVGKREYIRRLDAATTVCIGNGRNDCLMLKEAALGIAVILAEGAAAATLADADIVCTGILDALALLTHPLRLTATLRS